MGTNIHVTSSIFRHSRRDEFVEAVFSDADLAKVFPRKADPLQSGVWLWRNSGSGGGEQLVMLPEKILNGAWRHIKYGDRSPSAFVNSALSELRRVRDCLVKGSSTMAVTLAFTGIKLPDSRSAVDLGDGNSIARVRPEDRDRAPESLKQTLSGTDSSSAAHGDTQ